MKDSYTQPEKLWISDKTKIKFTLFGVLAICATIVGSTWAARGYLEDFRGGIYTQFSELKASQDKMTAALNYKWTVGQMEQWTNLLDKQNRDLLRKDNTSVGLLVPDPLSIISR